ncbi:Transposase IS116/IS110/IS902 family protein [compost metagenome]
MEATGHYWRNLFATLVGWGYPVALLNPLVTRRHAEAELARAKTDRADAESIARFLQEKRPAPTPLPSDKTVALKELVQWRERIVTDLVAKRNALHRLLDMVFPEFSSLVKDPTNQVALYLLDRWPLATQLAQLDPELLAQAICDGRHHVGAKLAGALVRKAAKTVGRHPNSAYALRIKATVAEVLLDQKHLAEVNKAIADLLDDDEQAHLLKSIPGVGDVTAATFLSEVGDPSRCDNAKQLVGFVGLAPKVSHSGKSTPLRGKMCKVGSKHLRPVLYMAAVAAIRCNPTIQAFYRRLCERGKPKRLAIGACAAKLLHMMFAVLRRQKPYEVLLVSVA